MGYWQVNVLTPPSDLTQQLETTPMFIFYKNEQNSVCLMDESTYNKKDGNIVSNYKINQYADTSNVYSIWSNANLPITNKVLGWKYVYEQGHKDISPLRVMVQGQSSAYNPIPYGSDQPAIIIKWL